MKRFLIILLAMLAHTANAQQSGATIGGMLDNFLNKVSSAVKAGTQEVAEKTNADRPKSPEEVRARIKKVFPSLESGDYNIEPTFTSNIWAIRRQGYTTRFVDDKVEIELNNGQQTKGLWRTIQFKQQLAEEDQSRRFKEIYQALAESSNLIKIGTPKEGTMIMYSAVDCPACIEIERELTKRKLSYYVVAGFLSEQNKRHSRAAFCSDNPSKSWAAYMRREGNPTSQNNVNCNYPEEQIKDFSWMLGGSTPAAIFPDGTIAVGIRNIFPKLGIQ